MIQYSGYASFGPNNERLSGAKYSYGTSRLSGCNLADKGIVPRQYVEHEMVIARLHSTCLVIVANLTIECPICHAINGDVNSAINFASREGIRSSIGSAGSTSQTSIFVFTNVASELVSGVKQSEDLTEISLSLAATIGLLVVVACKLSSLGNLLLLKPSETYHMTYRRKSVCQFSIDLWFFMSYLRIWSTVTAGCVKY